MKSKDIEQNLDQFVKEMFHGFSTLSMATSDEKQIEKTLYMIKGLDSAFKKANINKSGIEILSQLILDYSKGELDESTKTIFHHMILALRGMGLIINNNDSVSSLKMQMLHAEEKSKRLESENEMLKEELVNCRAALDSKKATSEAYK